MELPGDAVLPFFLVLSSASCLAPRMVVKIYGILQLYKWAILMRQPQCFFHPLPLIKIPWVQNPRNLPYYVIFWFVCARARHICITQKDCVAVRPYNLRAPPRPLPPQWLTKNGFDLPFAMRIFANIFFYFFSRPAHVVFVLVMTV